MTELPGNRPSVLFVCTANICRSPMAEGIFKQLLKERTENWEKWKIESAGTWTNRGNSAARKAIDVLADRGIDISSHSSRPINHVPVNRFRLVLAMEAGHKEALQIEFPLVASRTFLLSEMIGEVKNIDDPIGKPLEEFVKTANEIERILVEGYFRIRELVQTN